MMNDFSKWQKKVAEEANQKAAVMEQQKKASTANIEESKKGAGELVVPRESYRNPIFEGESSEDVDETF